MTPGSTGTHYAQIAQGAPIDVFLAADEARPERAEREGLAVPGSRMTYALGRLALAGDVDPADGAVALRAGAFTHLAVADPASAPYGAAALEVLDRLGVGWTGFARSWCSARTSGRRCSSSTAGRPSWGS